jgi:hypothetical protein
MRQENLFRISHALAAVFLASFFAYPAEALWLEVKGESYPVVAPLVVNLDGLTVPKGDTTHGFFAMPAGVGAGDPRLRLQYRADFPLSVTFETSGALVGDHDFTSGALSLTTRIIFVDRWWSPALNASLADVSLEGAANGRLEAGGGGLRTEWKLKF